MHLMRIGPAGAEKPVVRLDDRHLRRRLRRGRRLQRGVLRRRRSRSAARAGRRADRRRRRPASSPASASARRSRRPHQILCIGLNYSRPRRGIRAGRFRPSRSCSPSHRTPWSGPNDDVRMPRGSTKLDWEVELGIVIGTPDQLPGQRGRGRGRHRRLRPGQRRQRAGVPARAAAASGPRASRPRRSTRPVPGWSPRMRSPDVLDLAMWLDVNGRRRQTGSTSTMIFSPYFHRALPEPVPGARTRRPDQHRHPARGRRWGMTPPIWLLPGDVMELGIDGLGTQRQIVIAAR